MSKHGQLIYELICASRDHPTAEEVYLLAKNSTPKIAMATVYNNLNKLVAEGRIRRLGTAGEADRYDNATPHDHMQCVSCGRLHDLFLEDLRPSISLFTKEEVLSYDLTVRYLCAACKEKKQLARLQ